MWRQAPSVSRRCAQRQALCIARAMVVVWWQGFGSLAWCGPSTASPCCQDFYVASFSLMLQPRVVATMWFAAWCQLARPAPWQHSPSLTYDVCVLYGALASAFVVHAVLCRLQRHCISHGSTDQRKPYTQNTHRSGVACLGWQLGGRCGCVG